MTIAIITGSVVAAVLVVGVVAWWVVTSVSNAKAAIDKQIEAEAKAAQQAAAQPNIADKDRPFIDKDRRFDEKKDPGIGPNRQQPPRFGPGWPEAQLPQKQEPAPALAGPLKLPPAPPRLPIVPAKLEGDKVTRKLPDAIGQIAVGGGGRFLIAHLPKNRQLAIFDANEAKVVKYLPVASENVFIAAGMNKLLVAHGDTKILQRWDLLTFEREVSVPLPIRYTLCGIGMGAGSSGPLVVQSANWPVIGEHFYLDIVTMQKLPWQHQFPVSSGPNVQLRASMDGRVVGVRLSERNDTTIVQLSPGGLKTFRVESPLAVIPGPDGKHVFGDNLYTNEGRALSKQQNGGRVGQVLVPAYQGQYYLRVPHGAFHPQIPGDKRFEAVSVHIVGDTRPLITLKDVNGSFRDIFSGNRETLAVEMRYHLIPDAQLLVTIPTEADRFEVHRFDLEAALDKSGLDYLFVNSSAFPYAVRGRDWTYAMQVKSKKGGLKYRVDAGPRGMSVNAAGLVSWKAAVDHPEEEVNVILTVADQAGQEVFHTLKLNVVQKLPEGVAPPDQVAKVGPAAPEKKAVKAPEPVLPEPEIKVPTKQAEALTLKPPTLDMEIVTRNLPGSFDDAAIGGGGRYLLFGLPQQRQIALFDVNEARVVHYFAVSGDNVKFAAGLEKLVMVFPDTKIIQRWDLATRTREVTTTLDGVDAVGSVLMGSASHGPLVIVGGGERFRGGTGGWIDLKTLKAMNVRKSGQGHRGLDGNILARIAADGTVVGMWDPNVSPQGLQTLVVVGDDIKAYYDHKSVGHIVPGPDGKYVYTARGVFTNEVKPLLLANPGGVDTGGTWTIPAVQGNYYLSMNVSGRPSSKSSKKKAGGSPSAATIHLVGESRPLLTLPDLDLGEPINQWSREKFGFDKRILLIPDAMVLITLPVTNDRIVIRKLDIEAALDKAGIDYLYVTSRPPAEAQRGSEWLYPLAVRSKQGDVKYRLESGPDGMRVSAKGVIVWRVAADQPPGDVNIIITVSDRSGQEVFHTFRVRVP